MARGGRGGGRSGGGSRSSSGRSGRSFSSRRSGGSSRGSSFRGSSHRGGGGYGGGPSHHGHHHHHHHSSYGHHHHHHHYSGPRRRTSIVSSILASIIVFTIVMFVILQQTCNFAIAGCTGAFGGFGGTSTTRQREKLDSGVVDMTDWYTDELGWIEYESDLIKGMESFYEDTGIQPHLYLVDWNGEVSSAQASEFMQKAYDDLFIDEGHLLVCYFSCRDDSIDFVDGEPFMLCGEATKSIMDDEAEKIFWDEEYKNYENNNLYFEEYWGETFRDAGNRIMAAPIPWTTVAIVIAAIVGVVIIVIVIKKIVNAKIAQKNKEQEDLERMLDKPLETFGDDAVDDLMDKYDNADK